MVGARKKREPLLTANTSDANTKSLLCLTDWRSQTNVKRIENSLSYFATSNSPRREPMSRPSQNVTVTFSRHCLKIALIAAAILCLTCASLLAQVTSGTMFGTVKDPTGAMVKDASVTIANPRNGITRTVVTGGNGAFVAPNLLPGTYTVTVSAKGFKKSETTGIVLSAADNLSAGEFVLAVGTTSDEVTVTADAGQLQLQSNSGERSDLITGKQLDDVAMNGRNVLDYMKLIPGVVGTSSFGISGTGGIS